VPTRGRVLSLEKNLFLLLRWRGAKEEKKGCLSPVAFSGGKDLYSIQREEVGGGEED